MDPDVGVGPPAPLVPGEESGPEVGQRKIRRNLDSFAQVSLGTVHSVAISHGLCAPAEVEGQGSADGEVSTTVPIHDEASMLIAAVAELRLRQVIQEAVKGMRHCAARAKSELVTARDIDNAMRTLRIEPTMSPTANTVVKFMQQAPPPYDSLKARSDVWDRLRVAHRVTTRAEAVDDEARGDAGAASQETTVNLKDFAMKPLRPRCPPLKLSIHWLAIRGMVPKLPQNEDMTLAEQPLRRHPDSRLGGSGGVEDLLQIVHVGRADHLLSREHIIYLDQVRKGVRSSAADPTPEKVEAFQNILQSLTKARGMGQLVPYLVQFGVSEVQHLVDDEKGSVGALRTIVRFLSALILNPYIHLEYNAHQLLHALLTVILKPRISARSEPLADVSDLRRLAATAVSFFVFSSKLGLVNLLKRVTNIYKRHLYEMTNAVPSIVGALMGVRALGIPAIRTLVFPLVPTLADGLEETMRPGLDSASEERKQQVCSLLCELKGCLSDVLRDGMPEAEEIDRGTAEAMQKLLEITEVLGPAFAGLDSHMTTII